MIGRSSDAPSGSPDVTAALEHGETLLRVARVEPTPVPDAPTGRPPSRASPGRTSTPTPNDGVRGA